MHEFERAATRLLLPTCLIIGITIATDSASAQFFDDPTPSAPTRPISRTPDLEPAAAAPEVEKSPEHQGSIEVALQLGSISNGEFYNYYPVGLRLGYWFSDQFVVQCWFNYLFRADTGLTDFLSESFNQSLIVDAPPTLDIMSGIQVNWTLLSGRMAFGGDSEAGFNVGAGLYLNAGVEFARARDSDFDGKHEEILGEAHFGLGLRMFVGAWGGLTLEYRQHYFVQEPKQYPHPVEFSAMWSFLL